MGVTLVDTGVGLQGGPITSSGTISLSNTGVISGTYTNPAAIQVDDQGRIEAITSGGGGSFLPLSGGTMTGPLLLSRDPLSSMEAATQSYVLAHSGAAPAPRVGDYYASAYGASGSKNRYSGSISNGSTTLTTTTATDFAVGQGIYIAGGKAGGLALVTKVTAIAGTAITLQDAATAAVTAVANNIQHDDTQAIQDAINAAMASGGGTVYFEVHGYYRCNKGIDPSYDSVLTIPFTDWLSGTPPPTLMLRGNNVPIGAVLQPQHVLGPIIQTDLVKVTASSALLSSGQYSAGGAINGNCMTLYVNGITFRTYDNPNINCLEFGNLWNIILENVQVDTGISAEGGNGGAVGGAQPTHNTFGLRLPRLNQVSICNTNNISVSCYAIGIIASELWKTNSTFVQRCLVGIQSHESAANYPMTGNVLIIQCPTSMYFPAPCPVDLHIEFEVQNAGWWMPQPNKYIYDPTDSVTGFIRYVIITSGGTEPTPISTTGLSKCSVLSLVGLDNKIAGNLGLTDSLAAKSLSVYDGYSSQVVSVGVNDSGGTGARALGVVNSAGANAALVAGLVSYWKMDEPGATDMRADSRGTNHLSVASGTNCPAIAGKLGAHAVSSGSGGGFLQLGDNLSLHFTSSFTIAGWLRIHNLAGGTGWHVLLSKLSSNTDVSYWLMYRNDITRWEFSVSNNGAMGSVVSASTTTPTPIVDTWYFVAGVYNASTNQISISINAGTPATASFTGPVFMSTSNLACMLIWTGALNYGDCAVDEMGVWNRALTGSEITTLFNSNAGKTYPFP